MELTLTEQAIEIGKVILVFDSIVIIFLVISFLIYSTLTSEDEKKADAEFAEQLKRLDKILEDEG